MPVVSKAALGRRIKALKRRVADLERENDRLASRVQDQKTAEVFYELQFRRLSSERLGPAGGTHPDVVEWLRARGYVVHQEPRAL